MPTAMIPAGAHWDSMLKMLPWERNAVLPMETTITRITKATRMP